VGRLAGADRYGIAISNAQFANKGASAVVLATGTHYPDALNFGVGAAKAGGAVLLTKSTTLPDTTLGYLNAHHSTGVISATAQGLITTALGL